MSVAITFGETTRLKTLRHIIVTLGDCAGRFGQRGLWMAEMGRGLKSGEISSHSEQTPSASRVANSLSQLPSGPRGFVGRVAELAALDRALDMSDGRSSLVVITGPAGVGKTSVALRWLQTVDRVFDGGKLFVDLGGSAGLEPAGPSDVLGWFLLSLGVEPERVPLELRFREALFRSVTLDRCLLVLLDNAVSAAQVRPLLPAGSGSVVVVTSRSRLSGLAMDGARWVDAGPMGPGESVGVFEALVGRERVDAERAAAEKVAALCGGLPLGLAVVAARLASRPHRTFAREVTELTVETRRLTGMSLTGDASVEAVLDVSAVALSRDADRVYRCCAWLPGRDFTIELVVDVLRWSVGRVESAADDLVEANFVREVSDGRFAYHDLLRLHARTGSVTVDDGVAEDVVPRRAIEWYLNWTVAADIAIHPLRPRLGPRYDSAARREFADPHEAITWMSVERANVRAAIESAAQLGLHDLVWQFCEALWGFFLHTRNYGEWIELQRIGIVAAQECDDCRAEARLRSQVGFAYAKLRRFDDARTENLAALELARAAQDVQAEATALSQLGRAARGSGDLAAALSFYEQARDLQQTIGQVRGVALARRRIGQILIRLGRTDDAVDQLREAASVMAGLGDLTQHSRCLMILGSAYLKGGRSVDAKAVLTEALEMMREFGSPYYEAEILAELGEVAEQVGDHEGARGLFQRAGELYALVRDPKAEVMMRRAQTSA